MDRNSNNNNRKTNLTTGKLHKRFIRSLELSAWTNRVIAKSDTEDVHIVIYIVNKIEI